jgi:hypothetical protein
MCCYTQLGARPYVPLDVIKCQFLYLSYNAIHVISCNFMSLHAIACISGDFISCRVMSLHVLYHFILLQFNKVGNGRLGQGEGELCLSRPLSKALLSGQRQKHTILQVWNVLI